MNDIHTCVVLGGKDWIIILFFYGFVSVKELSSQCLYSIKV